MNRAWAAIRASALAGPVALAFASGGFYAEARLVALLSVAALLALWALVGPGPLPRERRARLALATMAAYCAWVALSAGWAPLADVADADLQRALLYLAALTLGDVTALLNPDITLRNAGLLALARAARARDALHVPRLLNLDGSVQDSVHPAPGSAADLARALVPGPVRRRIGEARPCWAVAAALVARTTTLRALGPFDPDAFLFYEDLDLGLRARAAGVPTTLHRDVAMVHAGGHSTGPEDVEVQVRRRREVVGARLGDRGRARDDVAQLLEHGLRFWRPRDRAYVRALRG